MTLENIFWGSSPDIPSGTDEKAKRHYREQAQRDADYEEWGHLYMTASGLRCGRCGGYASPEFPRGEHEFHCPLWNVYDVLLD